MPEDVLTSLPKGAKIISDEPKVLKSLPSEVKILGVEKSPMSQMKDFGADKLNEKKPTTEDIINNIPDIDEGRKQILKDITLRGVKGNDLRDAILTLQGKHPKQSQDGSIKYYLDNKGIPRALANDEKPPQGHDINSIWGEKSEAQDDHPLTTLGKNVFNILPSLAENAADLVHLPYGAIAGKEADWYKEFKNSANYLKMQTSDASKSPVLNTEGIDEFKDVFDPKRWNFTADNVAGTVGQIIKSVGEFGLGGGFVSKAVGATSKLGKGASLFTASYATQLGETIDRAKEAGLDTQDAYRVSSAINVPIALVDLGLGVEGRIFKDQTAKAGRQELVDNLVKGFVKDSGGKVTKEGLDDLFKATLVANTSLVKNWGKHTVSDVVGEGSQEAIQQFVQNAGEQLYDKMSDENKAKFRTDAFSAKSFADYLQNFVVGAIGGAPSGIAYNKVKAITKENEQSKTAFGLVQPKEGESIEDQNTRINAYKVNIANEVKQGKLTQEQADNALTRINSYKDYNDMVGSLKIDEGEKRQLFDLSFQKQNLETEIAGIKPEKLSPIEQAQYNVKEKFASDLQKQINEIVLKAQTQEETVVSEKTIKDVDKLENPPKKEGEKIHPLAKAMADKYKQETSKKEYPKEERTFEQIPVKEFNKLHERVLHEKLGQFLETQPNKTTIGTLFKKEHQKYKGGKPVTKNGVPVMNQTWWVRLKDGKEVRFSSSQETEQGHWGHFEKEHFPELEQGTNIEGMPIALKVGNEITHEEGGEKGHKPIKLFRPDTGKTIGYAKATKSGRNLKFTEKQKDELNKFSEDEPPIVPPTSGEIIEPTTPITPPEQLQKQKVSKGIVEVEHHENVLKVTKHIQSVLPKITVKYDAKLKSAGKLSSDGKTISINPYYAGLDTPIHEGGHVIIDAMGYNNPTIQSAIKQLRDTELYKETAKRYHELQGEMLDKEVLAEAIGREGAGIFDVEVKKNAFIKLLDKIYEWFKNKLGLDKNVAKTLAKQLIRGEHKSVEGVETGIEQYQKESFDELQKDLDQINEALDNEDLSEDEVNQLESVRDLILDKINLLENEGEAYKERENLINGLDIEKATLPELIDAYVTLEKQAVILTEQTGEKHYADKQKLKDIKEKIGDILNNTRIEDLQKKWGKEIANMANKKDLNGLNVWTKAMGHISEAFPAIQELYNEFNQVNLDKEKETYARKKELDKKAKAVIKETNKKLGVKDWAKGLFTSNSAKYFNYLEKDGKLRTDTKGLSSAQIEYLEAVRELIKEKNKLAGKETNDLEIIKIDKGFQEAFKNDGLMEAISLYLGGGENVDTPVTYTLNGKTQTVPYKDAQKAVLDYSKKGLKEKGIAIAKLLSLSYKAKKGAHRSDRNINYNGILTSKFNRPYDKAVGFSKDYHNATMQLIDDIAHVKHFNKLVPLANAVELFYQKTGVEQEMQFGHVLEFMRNWKNEQIYQKTAQLDPTIDAIVSFLRKMTSLTVMSFAVPANIMNVAIGNYNSIRKEGWIIWTKGQLELFAGDKHRAGFGFVGKKANDINNKYQIVKSDLDSNPKNHVGKWFDQLAFAGTRFGEYQIQLSLALGLMKEAGILDKFTYKNGELVVEGNEKEIEKKISEIKDKVSDIQGKYDPKDRRNIARYELGKAALQFKNWIPDWTKERFGAEYIDSKGVLHRGSWRLLSSSAIKEMKADMATHGKWLGLFKGDSVGSKNFRSNLNGLLFLSTLYILKNAGDDDDKKKRETLSLENAMEQVMFVYDPSQAKYLLKSPIASWGIIDKFLTIIEDIIDGKTEKAGKTAKKLIPHNKLYDDVNYLAGNEKK